MGSKFEWNAAKAIANLRKHGIDFADAAVSLEDPRALTMPDPDSAGEPRFLCLGTDPRGRVLVTVFTPREESTRIISSRRASRAERRIYEDR